MTRRFATALLCLLAPVCARAATIQGEVIDSSGAPIPGATVGLFSPVGVIFQRLTGRNGNFRFPATGDTVERLLVTAPGFATKTIPVPLSNPLRIQLDLAPVSDSIRVVGSTIDATASEQASSVTVVSGDEIRNSNYSQAADLLRTVPGLTIVQQGQRGGLVTLSIRGGDADQALVEIDGMPVNSFNYNGLFDFSQTPTDYLDRIEVLRGAQSALYGSYANSGVVNFVTRSGDVPAFDFLAEGGSHAENRLALTGSGRLAGFGVAASVSRVATNGEVLNSDWENSSVMLHLNRNWTRQSFSAGGTFDANAVGTPGPYGSDPLNLYTGLDLISRGKNNTSEYNLHYQADLTSRLRAELLGGFSLNNNFYASPYGDSFNQDRRGQGEARLVAAIAPHWTMSAGFVWAREEVRNTYITDNNNNGFLLHRDEQGIYWENRFQLKKLYLQVGLRGEIFETPSIPADLTNAGHPSTPSYTAYRVNPKIAAGYLLTPSTRLHASFGTGIRPPGGSELAFTDNPHLKAERNNSTDAGLSQSLYSGKLILDGTFFYNRYSDLIVSLGGDLAKLSQFHTDNLANARSRGAELSAQVRPLRWVSFTANYLYLDTAVLALNHTGLAQTYYRVGQQLLRRPAHSGSFRLGLARGHVSGELIGSVRGATLDVEPNYGTSEGFFLNPGFASLAVNVSVAVSQGLSVYGSLRNALNEHYEEIFGYPSPRLTFVSGVKWSFRGRE